MFNIRLIMAVGAPLFLLGCNPPEQKVLANCEVTAANRASGQNLTKTDLGELTEACMASRGFILDKTGRSCAHDLSSQTNRSCYYPDTRWARFYHSLH